MGAKTRTSRARRCKVSQRSRVVAATTKKLEKAALLGAYFHTLSDERLLRAARYFAGPPVRPERRAHDERRRRDACAT